MRLAPKSCVALFGSLALAMALPATAQQQYPSKPIKIVVPFAVGGIAFQREEASKWAKAILEANIKVE